MTTQAETSGLAKRKAAEREESQMRGTLFFATLGATGFGFWQASLGAACFVLPLLLACFCCEDAVEDWLHSHTDWEALARHREDRT